MAAIVVSGFFPKLSAADSALALLTFLGFTGKQIQVRLHYAKAERSSWIDAAYSGIPKGVMAGSLAGLLSAIILAFSIADGWPAILPLIVLLPLGAACGMIFGALTELIRIRFGKGGSEAGVAIRVLCPTSTAEAEAKEIFARTGARPN